jgi:hypothetical protein
MGSFIHRNIHYFIYAWLRGWQLRKDTVPLHAVFVGSYFAAINCPMIWHKLEFKCMDIGQLTVQPSGGLTCSPCQPTSCPRRPKAPMARWTPHSTTPNKFRMRVGQTACCTCGNALDDPTQEIGSCAVQWQTAAGRVISRCDHFCHMGCSVGNFPGIPGEAQRRLHCGCHGQAVRLAGMVIWQQRRTGRVANGAEQERPPPGDADDDDSRTVRLLRGTSSDLLACMCDAVFARHGSTVFRALAE